MWLDKTSKKAPNIAEQTAARSAETTAAFAFGHENALLLLRVAGADLSHEEAWKLIAMRFLPQPAPASTATPEDPD